MALTGSVAGDARWATSKLTAFLYEGDITPGQIEDNYGNARPAVVRSAPLKEGDLVELFDDEALTYDALGGIPMLRALSESGTKYIGRIIEIEKAQKQIPATAITELSDMISGGFLRVATVEMVGMCGMGQIEVTIPANDTGPDELPVADPTKLIYNVSNGGFEFGDGKDTQLVPLTRLTGSTTADVTGNVLVGIGLQKLVLG